MQKYTSQLFRKINFKSQNQTNPLQSITKQFRFHDYTVILLNRNLPINLQLKGISCVFSRRSKGGADVSQQQYVHIPLRNGGIFHVWLFLFQKAIILTMSHSFCFKITFCQVSSQDYQNLQEKILSHCYFMCQTTLLHSFHLFACTVIKLTHTRAMGQDPQTKCTYFSHSSSEYSLLQNHALENKVFNTYFYLNIALQKYIDK